MKKNHTSLPVIVGAAQFTQQRDAPIPLDPMGLMTKAGEMAIADAGPDLRDVIDTVYVTNIAGWRYRDAPGTLINRLGLRARQKEYSPVGGTAPQVFVNRAARDIAAGRSTAILMSGGEAVFSSRRALKNEITLNWPIEEPHAHQNTGERSGYSILEQSYGLVLPVVMYALMETAVRAFLKQSIDEHRQGLGRMLENFSQRAADNLHAWTRTPYTASEIVTPSPQNRQVCHPYTKLMISNNVVDQSAALVMTDTATAGKLGIDRSRWVYPMGGADLNNIYHVTERPFLHDSPALAMAADHALRQAGCSLGDIGAFDLYSCFPSMVEIACIELGIEIDDPRGLTVTGGLPYFGAPFNNYSMHAIASVVERIRADSSLKAMVTANGWYNTKHSVGIYGADPPAHGLDDEDMSELQASIDARALSAPLEKAEGGLTVLAYTIAHNREGAPDRGIALGRHDSGERALALIDAGPEELEKYETIDLVGMQGNARYDSGRGLNLVKIRV